MTDLLVLAVLARGESYAAEIHGRIAREGQVALSEAAVRRALAALVRRGHAVTREEVKDTPTPGRARRFYKATSSGDAHFATVQAALLRLSSSR